jgi:hypothetical protein
MSLIYTLAFDPPNSRCHALMAKLLAASLQRTNFTGDIVIFRNSPEPIFKSAREGIREVFLAEPHEGWANTMAWKWRVVEMLEVERYHRVLFLDCDCLVLRNIDHLMPGDYDLFYCEEPDAITKCFYNSFLTDQQMKTEAWRRGSNGGTIGFRGRSMRRVVKKWQEIAEGPHEQERWGEDQTALNRLIVDAPRYGWRRRPFERGEVVFPLIHQPKWVEYMQATVLHAAYGGAARTPEKKLQFLYGLYMQRFHHRSDGLLIDLVEP